MKKLRILYMSNAIFSHTGYGVQGASLLPRLKTLDSVEDIAIFDFYGHMGGITEFQGIVHYPLGLELWGNDIIEDHLQHFKADILITLMDIWVVKSDFGKKFKWVPWFPVDSSPPYPTVIERAKNAWIPVTYSKFSVKELNKVGISAYYIPHGVETNIFKPYSDFECKGAKKWLSFNENTFVIGMVAANKGFPCRKGFPQAFEAVAKFMKNHKNDDVGFYVHSRFDKAYGGIDLVQLAKFFEIDEITVFPNPYHEIIGFSSDEMAVIYNAFDVLLNPSMGEGFGIPIIEAQACGVPVIVTNFSSMPELCGSGFTVGYSNFYHPFGAWWALPDVNEIYIALEKVYENKKSFYSDKAVNFAKEYNWDKVVNIYWKPFLEEAQLQLNNGGDAKWHIPHMNELVEVV